MNYNEAIKMLQQGKVIKSLSSNMKYRLIDDIQYYYSNTLDGWMKCYIDIMKEEIEGKWSVN